MTLPTLGGARYVFICVYRGQEVWMSPPTGESSRYSSHCHWKRVQTLIASYQQLIPAKTAFWHQYLWSKQIKLHIVQT